VSTVKPEQGLRVFNDLWFASITLWPQRHTLMLIATNSGSDAAEKMVLDLRF
jgi:hypothetical protein